MSCTKLIAELHSAGLSNQAIGQLLEKHGGKSRDESTVRWWATGKSEPRASDWQALHSLKAEVFREQSEKFPIEVKQTIA